MNSRRDVRPETDGKKRLEVHGSMALGFVHLEKAFDTVPREIEMATLRWMGVPDAEVRMVEDMYEKTTAIVMVGEVASDEFEVKIGLRQGSVLSLLLLISVLDLISRKTVVKDAMKKHLYADDLALEVNGKQELQDTLEEWNGLFTRHVLSPLLFIAVLDLISRKTVVKDAMTKHLYADDLALEVNGKQELQDTLEEWNGLFTRHVLSQLLFIAVLDLISRKTVVKDAMMKHLYADDLALVANGKQELQETLEDWNGLFARHGLKINVEKTEVLHIGNQKEELNIELEGKKLTQGDSSVRGAVGGDGNTDREIMSKSTGRSEHVESS